MINMGQPKLTEYIPGMQIQERFGNEKGCFRRSYRMICMNNFQPGKCMKSSPAVFKASWLRLISSCYADFITGGWFQTWFLFSISYMGCHGIILPIDKVHHIQDGYGTANQYIFEGSLEVKLPTIWRDEKQSREEA